jgi:hypothetical protein
MEEMHPSIGTVPLGGYFQIGCVRFDQEEMPLRPYSG